MRFGQLIEFKTSIIFLEKPDTKCGGETSSRPFSKKLKLSISMPSWGLSKYIETKLQTTCIYLILSYFEKKRRSGTSLPDWFSA